MCEPRGEGGEELVWWMGEVAERGWVPFGTCAIETACRDLTPAANRGGGGAKGETHTHANGDDAKTQSVSTVGGENAPKMACCGTFLKNAQTSQRPSRVSTSNTAWIFQKSHKHSNTTCTADRSATSRNALVSRVLKGGGG